MKKLIIIGLFLLIPLPSQAKTFSSGYVQFELSPEWDCNFENSEYVCSPLDPLKSREVIIVMAAKIAGEEDSIKNYYNYLKKPKNMKDRHGKKFTSKINFIKYKTIQETQWVDAIHLSSEVPNFYTRYLATVKSGLGILMTYSVAKDKQVFYANELIKMADSIKVTAKAPPKPLSTPKKPKLKTLTPPKKPKKKEEIIERLTTTPD